MIFFDRPQPQSQSQEKKSFPMPRRRFLKLAGATAAMFTGLPPYAAARSSEPPHITEKQPQLPEIKLTKAEWIQYIDITGQLSETLRKQLAAAIPETETNEEPIDADKLAVDDQYALQQILNSLNQHYTDHNQLVQGATNQALAELDRRRELTESPVFAIEQTVTDSRFYRDRHDNPWVSFRLDQETISSMVTDSPQFIAVLPFMMGENSYGLQTVTERDPKPLYIEYTIQGETYYSQKTLGFFPYSYLSRSLSEASQARIAESPHALNENTNVQQVEVTLNSDNGEEGEWFYLDESENLAPNDPDYYQTLGQANLLAVNEYHYLVDSDIINGDEYRYQADPRNPSVTYFERITFSNPRLKMRSIDDLRYDPRIYSYVFPEEIEQKVAVDLNDLLTEEKFYNLPKELTHHQEPQIGITEGYHATRAYQGLQEMYYVAENNPDKLIITAAGNYGSFFDQAMEQLASEGRNKPQNLLLVGFYIGSNTATSYKPDIYLSIGDQFESSSESTGYMGGVALVLAQRLLQQEQYQQMTPEEQKAHLLIDLPLEIQKYTYQRFINERTIYPESESNENLPVAVLDYDYLYNILNRPE